MSIHEPRPVVCTTCARCAARSEQRWIVALERPADAWSQCDACGWITIWTSGRVERPAEAAGRPMPRDAVTAIGASARGALEATRARLDQLQRELAQAEMELTRIGEFVDRFVEYQQRCAAEIADCGQVADNVWPVRHHASS